MLNAFRKQKETYDEKRFSCNPYLLTDDAKENEEREKQARKTLRRYEKSIRDYFKKYLDYKNYIDNHAFSIERYELGQKGISLYHYAYVMKGITTNDIETIEDDLEKILDIRGIIILRHDNIYHITIPMQRQEQLSLSMAKIIPTIY